MPRKLFKRWSPDPHRIRRYPGLRFLGKVLHDPNLLHLNRHSVSEAVFLGVFLAFLPIPGQIPLAAIGALLLRCNLPIAIALVWITNPLTFAFIFFACYKLGLWILNLHPHHVHFQFTWEWMTQNFMPIWPPLVLGCLIMSLFLSCTSYLVVQWSWRWHTVKKWNARKARRQSSSASKKTHS